MGYPARYVVYGSSGGADDGFSSTTSFNLNPVNEFPSNKFTEKYTEWPTEVS